MPIGRGDLPLPRANLLIVGIAVILSLESCASPNTTSRDDPLVAYNAAVSDMLHLGGCSTLFRVQGDGQDMALFDRFARQAAQDPEMQLVFNKSVELLAIDAQSMNQPHPRETAEYMVQTIRDGAKQELGIETVKNRVGVEQACNEMLARAQRGETPYRAPGRTFPVTVARLRALP